MSKSRIIRVVYVNFDSDIILFPFPKVADRVYVGRGSEVDDVDIDTDWIEDGDQVLIPAWEVTPEQEDKIIESFKEKMLKKYDVVFVYVVRDIHNNSNVIGWGR